MSVLPESYETLGDIYMESFPTRCICGYYSVLDGTENFCGGCGRHLEKPLQKITYECSKCGPVPTEEYKATAEYTVNFCGFCGIKI